MPGAAAAYHDRAQGEVHDPVGNPPFALFGSAVAVQVPLPGLVAGSASVGGTLTLSLASDPGDPFLLALALPSNPIPHQAGLVFVDFLAWAVLAQSVQGASGLTTLPVPNEPSLRGAAFVVQAASFATSLQTLFFTNPDVVVLD